MSFYINRLLNVKKYDDAIYYAGIKRDYNFENVYSRTYYPHVLRNIIAHYAADFDGKRQKSMQKLLDFTINPMYISMSNPTSCTEDSIISINDFDYNHGIEKQYHTLGEMKTVVRSLFKLRVYCIDPLVLDRILYGDLAIYTKYITRKTSVYIKSPICRDIYHILVFRIFEHLPNYVFVARKFTQGDNWTLCHTRS